MSDPRFPLARTVVECSAQRDVSELRTRISLHEISSCGQRVRSLRLDLMISAATHVDLVVRRHVDYGRTRSMMCWHR